MKLESGKSYTLGELFGAGRIIIPDLQRDYCWGTDKKGLARCFVEDMIALYNDNHKKIDIGLIYGYEEPSGSIQLCDGQQRLTTLFLLLGMLRRHLENAEEAVELLRAGEPILEYAIRESTLFFLGDLCRNFFRSYNKSSVGDIKGLDWYFKDYDLDPSVQSIIVALKAIEKILFEHKEIDICSFVRFLLCEVSFLYIDVKDRKNGEETFVVINTTGEPLSCAQNLKPLVINASINKESKNIAARWEKIETWFWQHRSADNDTSDAGMEEFLRWVAIMKATGTREKAASIVSAGFVSDGKCVFNFDEIPFDEVERYFLAVKFVFDKWTRDGKVAYERSLLSPKMNGERRAIDNIECFRLLPVIEFCKTYSVNSISDMRLRRLYEFVYNLSRLPNVQNNAATFVCDVLSIARSCSDVVDILKDENKTFRESISKTLLSKEELLKLKILRAAGDKRECIERAFWRAQDYESGRSGAMSHKIFAGEIKALIDWSMKSKDVFSFNADVFEKYVDVFDMVFAGDCGGNIDIVRRVLLNRKFNGYPRKFYGSKNLSFCWEWEDWHRVLYGGRGSDNLAKFKAFFDELLPCTDKSAFDAALMPMLSSVKNKEWECFIKEPELLSYCEHKNIQWDNRCKTWLLVKRTRATTYMILENMLLVIEMKQRLKDRQGWTAWIYDGENMSVAVVENGKRDIVFDTSVEAKGGKKVMTIEMFRRKKKAGTEFLSHYIDKRCWKKDRRGYILSVECGDNNVKTAADIISDTVYKIERSGI